MKLATLLVLGSIGTISATPIEGTELSKKLAGDDPFDVSYLSSLNDFFVPHFPLAFLNKDLFGVESSLRRASPRYEIAHDADKVVVTVEVPGYKYHEIEVELKAGGRVLSISGDREVKDGDEMVSTSHFQQSFTLDPSVETEYISANLADGLLVITAPRQHELPANRKIAVTQFDTEILDEMTKEQELEEEVAQESPYTEKTE